MSVRTIAPRAGALCAIANPPAATDAVIKNLLRDSLPAVVSFSVSPFVIAHVLLLNEAAGAAADRHAVGCRSQPGERFAAPPTHAYCLTNCWSFCPPTRPEYTFPWVSAIATSGEVS